jgi:hypothetical protein
MRRNRSASHTRRSPDFGLKLAGLALAVVVCMAIDHALALGGGAVPAPF